MNEIKEIQPTQPSAAQLLDNYTEADEDKVYNFKEALEFTKFMHEIQDLDNVETNTTATGVVTIQQTPRNEMRRKGLAALKNDLMFLYGDAFDIVETKEGIIIVAENYPCDFTFSWELKSTIKSLDFDPFLEANIYEEDCAAKEEKRIQREAEKKAKIEALEIKRAKKLAEIERRSGGLK